MSNQAPSHVSPLADIYAEIDFPQHPAVSTEAQTEQRTRGQFREPIAIHAATQLCDVASAIAKVEAARARGHWCVGFVAHEAAPAFDAAFVVNRETGTPLVWFAEFADMQSGAKNVQVGDNLTLGRWQSDTSAAQFASAVESIRADIREGRFYQVNYTTRLHADFSGDAHAFFRALQAAQPNGYHLFIDAGDFQLLSVSPELFFAVRDGVITTQPMKGTAPRGDTASEDAAIAEALTHSPKERAENLMIVDLLRNDLSRIAEPHSVEVPHLFSLHPLPSVWQMTSTVRATLPRDKTLADIFAALFPCGSVTGAPKVEAMKSIAMLEAAPRGIYCGAIGYAAPNGVACFNVGIRSVLIENGTATCGVGSGITYDSSVAGEAAELSYKSRFVIRASKSFQLFETMRLDNGEYTLCERHLARLENSARHFRFAMTGENGESLIQTARLRLNALKRQVPSGVWRVKLIVNRDGQCHTECHPLDATPAQPTIQLAACPISRNDEFLQHKTTRREVYDQHAPADGVWDTLLFNEECELTEFIRANLVLDIAGNRFTPPLSCGLLNGTLREEMIACGEISERVLMREDLLRAEKIWWVNGLRGEILVRLAAM
jgi:para-aminobenzoate synthetase / 4-amino-4-deoxychorismate lyase